MKEILELKSKLFNACSFYVLEKIDLAKKGIKAAQDAANNETKSSAGDKFETGRAMMQIERDKYARKLSEAIVLKNILSQIPIDKIHSDIKNGSLVYTNMGIFFISISAGKLLIDDGKYFAISEAAPIVLQLKKMGLNEKIIFNQRELILNNIQ